MPSVDTRIVQMQFDNRDFEKNIAVSQKSLEKFKDELDFDEQEDNLRDFGDAVKSGLESLIRCFHNKAIGSFAVQIICVVSFGVEVFKCNFNIIINIHLYFDLLAGVDLF